MNTKYSYLNFFPSPIHIFDIDGFDKLQNDLIDHAYKLKKQDPDGCILSNRGGWQSKSFLLNREDDIIHTTIIEVLKSFPVIKNTTEMRSSAWVNINGPGSYNVIHDHPNTHLSGVIWIKSPKDCGVIEFKNPHDHPCYNEINSYTEEFKDEFFIHHAYWLSPIEGRVVIFPAHLRHEVKENKSNEDRISVSFNVGLINHT